MNVWITSPLQLQQNAVLVLPTSGGTWTREQVRQDPIQNHSR
ncbi:hypothetical protein [Paenibacillus xylanilyticus]